MEWCSYTLRSRGSLNAVSRRSEFHGALIRVESGVGCLHPWPEFGDAEIEGQLRILREGGTSKVIERALHMAQVDGEARGRKVSLFAGLEIPPCHYSWDQNQSADTQMRRVAEEGWQAIKAKGTADVNETLGSLAGTAPVKLRLDFNSCLREEDFSIFMEKMPSQTRERLDFVEDPFSYEPDRWEAARKRFGVRFALDKQLRGAKGGFDVAVLKPGRREWREMVQEMPSQVGVVMTSAMDHAIGQSFAAYEAALAWKELGPRMDLCGLCTEHLFEEDAFFARLSSRGGKLEVDRNGTGLGFDDILEKLPWRSL